VNQRCNLPFHLRRRSSPGPNGPLSGLPAPSCSCWDRGLRRSRAGLPVRAERLSRFPVVASPHRWWKTIVCWSWSVFCHPRPD
jgi:hypothetical protein